MPLFAKAWKYYLLLKESLVSLFRWPQALKKLPLCPRNKTKNLAKPINRTHLYNTHRRTWCCYLLCFCCFGFQRREGLQGLLLFLSVLVVGNVLWFPFVFRCRLFCRIADDDSAERYHGFWQFQHLTEGFYPVFHRIDPRPDSAQSH